MSIYNIFCTLTGFVELGIASVKYARYTPVPVSPDCESYAARLGGSVSTVTLVGDYLGCPVTLAITPQLANQEIVVKQLRPELTPQIDTSNCGSYYDPRLTDLIFNFVSPIPNFNVQLNLNGIFLPINFNRTEIRILDNGQWQIVSSQVSDGVISFEAATGTYAVCLNVYAYSSFTQRMANLLPSWLKIRQDPLSIGQRFLNYFGVELDDVRGYLDWVLSNEFVTTADISVLDHTYRGVFPINLQPGRPLKVLGNNHPVAFTTDQVQFRRSNNQLVLLDYTHGLIHSKAPYQGYLILVYDDQEYTVDLAYHQVWNAFDEFALLLGLTRWPGESNTDLRGRILDVFRYPGNATKLGLYQSIGRSLGFVRRLTWPDDGNNLVLHDHRIVDGTILVDGAQTSCLRSGV